MIRLGTSTAIGDDTAASPTLAYVIEGVPACRDGSVAFRWRHPVFDRS